MAALMHQYNGYCFIDFAASAPYVNIDMHPENNDQRLDVIFFSPQEVSDFYQDSLTLSDGTRYVVPEMTTWNVTADYTFNTPGDSDTRIRFGINNVSDERAPLADRFFGYFADAHRDLGRSFYLDLRFRIQ